MASDALTSEKEQPGAAQLCHPGRVLAEMRNARGGPNWRVRALALLLALLLAGPLTVFLLSVAAQVLDLAL